MEATHKSKLFKCEECFMAYSSKYALKRHSDRCHNENATRYTCSEEGCTYYSYRGEDLINHEKRHMNPTFKTRKNSNSTPLPKPQDNLPSCSTFTQDDLDHAFSAQLLNPNFSASFPTVDESFFQDPTIVSIKKTSEVPDFKTPELKETSPQPEPYQPITSNISSPEDLVDTSGTIYEPGLCLFATKNGRLQVKKNALKPGMKCIVNDNFELISEEMMEYKDLTKNDSSNTTQASFNIQITSPDNNINGCATQ